MKTSPFFLLVLVTFYLSFVSSLPTLVEYAEMFKKIKGAEYNEEMLPTIPFIIDNDLFGWGHVCDVLKDDEAFVLTCNTPIKGSVTVRFSRSIRIKKFRVESVKSSDMAFDLISSFVDVLQKQLDLAQEVLTKDLKETPVTEAIHSMVNDLTCEYYTFGQMHPIKLSPEQCREIRRQEW